MHPTQILSSIFFQWFNKWPVASNRAFVILYSTVYRHFQHLIFNLMNYRQTCKICRILKSLIAKLVILDAFLTIFYFGCPFWTDNFRMNLRNHRFSKNTNKKLSRFLPSLHRADILTISYFGRNNYFINSF